MNILLIYPPMDVEVPAKSTLLGLGYLASVLRDKGHNAMIIDCSLANRAFKINHADYIGISCMFTDCKKSNYNFIKNLKEIYPKIPFIVGGAHA